MSLRKLTPIAAMCALALPACGSPGGNVRATINQYEVGNFNAAAHACWQTSDGEEHLNDKAHMRYLVYCGLTYYRLGRRAEARQMLTRGNEEYLSGRLGWLKPAIVDELYKALDDLEGRVHPRPRQDKLQAR